MPSTKRGLPCWVGALLGMVLVFFIGVPAQAFAPATSPLLSAAAVTPNVMLLVDNSGSMDTIVMDTGFNPDLNWPTIYNVTTTRVCSFFTCTTYYAQGNAVSSSYDFIYVRNLSTSYCSNGQYSFYKNATSVICLTLPDPQGSGLTRYPMDYLSYLVSLATAGSTVPTIPNASRMTTAITAATNIVTNNRSLRFGLATFNPPANSDPGPGGRISQAITDMSAVTAYGTTGLVPAVSQTTADKNFATLKSAIAALTASSNTPLAETYYEITRYMRGMAPYYNSTPSTYTSPIQYRCQKNFGVVITDGLPTYDRTFPKDDPIGGTSLPNWDGINNDGNNPTGGDAEGDSLYLDDIAKFAYDIDMRNKLTTTDATGKSWDAADFPKQNMFTYAIGFTASNQMLLDTASYGHGKFYLATDSATLNTALTAALSDITSKAGSGGTGASNASTASSTSVYYQALYDPIDWRGIIKAFPISSTGTVSTTETWNSNSTMAVGKVTPKFESYNVGAAATSTAAATAASVVALDFNKFTTTQQTSITQSLPTGVTGANLINWTMGTNVTGLRTRTELLGDIINSPLTLASATDQTASDLTSDTTYIAYLATKASGMTNSLVVNSNDGFTNVITAATGARAYAYLPSTALASLYKVADTGYINGSSHAFLNDGQVGVYDAQVSGGWKTLALSGTGGGGTAYSAIQLYDATLGNVVKALWELRPDTSTAFANLGYAYSKPEVARLPNNTWAAFIANGYGSTKGVASLFVVDLATGALIKEIVADSTTGTNGLSSVKLVVNSNGVATAAYGGDLQGRMWKFDLSNTSPASWAVAFSGNPLFTAPGKTNEPITAQPLLVTNSSGGKMVYFGTGKLLETADKTTTNVEGFYAVWDSGSGTGNYTVSNLQAQAVNGVYTSGTSQYVTSTANTTDYTALKGWYLPLSYGSVLTGHRVIYPASYTSGRVIFTSADVDTTDPCASQGSGYIFELDGLNGSLLSYPVLDTNGDGSVTSSDTRVSGLFISTGIPNLNAILNVTATSSTPSSQRKIVNDSSGTITTLVEATGVTSSPGRILWRQIQ